MTDFFRFPHTPHIMWLGHGTPRDDKVLSEAEVGRLLSSEVTVEEKVDGANIGISLDGAAAIKIQNRGQYLEWPFRGQFSRLGAWIAQHEIALRKVLSRELILFGEWCAAVHSVEYEMLPDWFLLFDVYDREANRLYSVARRNSLACDSGIFTVPELSRGRVDVDKLVAMVSSRSSCFSPRPLEGLIVRQDSGTWSERRGKLVRADFIQSIGDHWNRGVLRWNKVVTPGDESRAR